MKPILTALFLIVSLLIGWGCTHTAVKSGPDQQEPAVESQSRTEPVAEQSKGETFTLFWGVKSSQHHNTPLSGLESPGTKA